MSGTIAAATDNGVGVAGVVPRAKIQPVRVLGTGGGGAGSDILAGIYWAAGVPVSGAPANATPAKVINMSLRGNSPGCPASYQQAINAANCENVVTVAAIGPQGYSAAYSNIGPRIDLAAPGGDSFYPGGSVLSTINTGTTGPAGPGYASYEGTSMATPHVARAVALLLSVVPDLTPAEVEARLKAMARLVSQCSVADCGAGILDAAALVPIAPVEPVLPVTRFSGSDRYSTAVEVSKAKFTTGSDTVFVSSRVNFPDALATGPAAALHSAPLLLVPREGILPVVVDDELRRLNPGEIHVIGGFSAASEGMVHQLWDFAEVGPFNGDNRYDTAAYVATVFGDTGRTVFIATGANYSDALAGGAAAGRLGGTLLLTARDQLPPETAEAFDWLKPSRIVLLGGASAISDSVLAQIQAVLPGVPVDRAAGSDRFATAAATAALAFPPGRLQRSTSPPVRASLMHSPRPPWPVPMGRRCC